MHRILRQKTNNLYEPWPVSSTVLCGDCLASVSDTCTRSIPESPFLKFGNGTSWRLVIHVASSMLPSGIRSVTSTERNLFTKVLTCLLFLAKPTTALVSDIALFSAFLCIQRDQGAPLSQRYRLPRLGNEESARERPRKNKCTAPNNEQTAMLLPKDAMQIRPVQLQTKEFIRNTRAGSYWARVLCRYAFVLSRPKRKIPTPKWMKSGRWSQTGRRAKQRNLAANVLENRRIH